MTAGDQPAAGRPLQGRTALVTGGAVRIGRAIVEALSAAGAAVVIHYNHSHAPAEQLRDRLVAAGGRAFVCPAELGEPAAAEGLFAAAEQQAGPIDVVVNNASIFPPSKVMEFAFDELAENMRVNAYAPLALARALAAAGREGDVLNLLDTRMLDLDNGHAAYHLSKRTLSTLTRMLAMELAPRIRVNAIAPGLVLPPPGQDETYLQANAHTNPLNTYGSAEEVARAAVFLLQSRFVTGQVLYVDGGRHMKGRLYE